MNFQRLTPHPSQETQPQGGGELPSWPAGRCGACCFFTSGRAYIALGATSPPQVYFNDVWELSFVPSLKWTQLRLQQHPPTPGPTNTDTTAITPEARFLASCVLLDKKTALIMGGRSDYFYNDMFLLVLAEDGSSTYHWKKIQPTSSVRPTNRASHQALLHGSKMYIFGGLNEFGGFFNELWRFNLKTLQWSLIEMPFPSAGRSDFVFLGPAFINPLHFTPIVGFGYDGRSFNDCWVLQENYKWVALPNNAKDRTPPERHNCIGEILNEDTVFLYGGADFSKPVHIYYNDAHIYNKSTSSWKRIQVLGDIPTKRAGCCSTVAQMPWGERIILIFFGSNWNLNIDFKDMFVVTTQLSSLQSLCSRAIANNLVDGLIKCDLNKLQTDLQWAILFFASLRLYEMVKKGVPSHEK